MEDKKVLIINTGGTISMVHSDKNDPESALRPSKSWSEVVKNYQFLENLNVGYAQDNIGSPSTHTVHKPQFVVSQPQRTL